MKLTWANRITILRIFLTVPFVIFMLKINDPAITDPKVRNAARYIAFAIFLVMAVSDAFDGYLARAKNQITKLGAFLDPTADKLLITSASLLLASQRGGVPGFRLPSTVVVLIVGKDLLVLIGFVIVYFITGQVRIAPATIGKVATILQLSMVAAVLIGPEMSSLIPAWIWFLRLLWWSAAAAAVLAMLIYFRAGQEYIEQYEQNNQHPANG